ncbi:putative RNA export mediator Gle1 [Talaromyces proteolyticus]|uniref:mRNA export factor GLE1 n=1 Tax=Talaromyces proteolyticus TaxID=1131652 RepID=A0AAD4KP98_9EURO|nr:putative RNA export mediator Gle1 [Talaromyces proteolyticus]KAH8697372.1 putative RNA export mediator Gle1 [Talaromyces proteolyticus]
MVKRRSVGNVLDSPSRQLIVDLTKDLEAIRLHHEDLKRVYDYRTESFTAEQDEIDRTHQEVYYAAIDKAYDYYDKHRREAEVVLKEHLREEEEKRRRREEEERRRKEERERLERERKEREEAEKRRQEEARREAERLAQEEQHRRLAAEAEAKARKAAEEEKARREREEAEEKERQRQAELQKAKEAEKRRQTLGVQVNTEQEVKEHERYLELHKYLKQLRKYVLDEAKKDQALKNTIGDYRRGITKCIGQLREGQGANANKGQMTEIREILRKSQTIPLPCDARRFFIHVPEQFASLSEEEAKVSAVFIYLLNIFTKAVVSQLINEAGVKLEYAEPVGIVVAQIFSTEQYSFQGHAFSDIFWAKYRASCPALWGFYGKDNTEAGRLALGWKRVDPGGPFVDESDHQQRMIGLGCGFAAITLRNFGKTTRKNPFPNHNFWRAICKIVFIPPDELQDTHFYILYAMLRFAAERVVGFWGQAGLALLRTVIVDVPGRVTRKHSGAIGQLKVLRGLYATEKSIIL